LGQDNLAGCPRGDIAVKPANLVWFSPDIEDGRH
jgi:hypothetical protein